MSAVDLRVADTSALPCRTRCPMCSGTRLTIYEDTISGGAWHYCFDCHSTGDMIELAAKVWKTSPHAAFLKLKDRGLPIPDVTPEAINTYVASYPQRRNRINKLATDSFNYLRTTASPVLNGLRDMFRLKGNMSDERWRDGPGRMVGGYPALEVERAFTPNSIVDDQYCSAASRIFVGGKWKEVLTIPYFDLPGRICGFLFVGRNGGKDDFVYKVVVQRPLRTMASTGEQEGGLSCLWAGNEPNTRLGRYAVAIADPMLALRLQVRHYSSAKRPLPIVAFRDGHKARTKAAWRALDKTPVIWGWRLSAAMVNQAMISEGRLHVTELRDTSKAAIDHYIRDNEPIPLVRRVIEKGLPWREFLVEWAANKEDGVVEALFAALDGYGIDRNTYANLCPRLRGLAERRDPIRTVRVSKMEEVVERDGQWFLRRKNSEILLLNAVIRIDGTKLVEGDRSEDGESVVYCGRVLVGDRECPFEYTGSTLEALGTKVLQKPVTRAGIDCTLASPTGFKAMLLRTALLFRAAGVT